MPKLSAVSPKGFMLRAAIFAGLWWILAEGRPDSLWIGIPVILGAAAASLHLSPPLPAPGLRAGAFGRLVLHFIFHSLRGGVDVALRALDPRLPLAPDLLEYPLRLPSGAARVFLVNMVSLMPGTLSVALREDVLCIHALDRRQPLEAELRSLEARVAEAFGLPADSLLSLGPESRG